MSNQRYHVRNLYIHRTAINILWPFHKYVHLHSRHMVNNFIWPTVGVGVCHQPTKSTTIENQIYNTGDCSIFMFIPAECECKDKTV